MFIQEVRNHNYSVSADESEGRNEQVFGLTINDNEENQDKLCYEFWMHAILKEKSQKIS